MHCSGRLFLIHLSHGSWTFCLTCCATASCPGSQKRPACTRDEHSCYPITAEVQVCEELHGKYCLEWQLSSTAAVCSRHRVCCLFDELALALDINAKMLLTASLSPFTHFTSPSSGTFDRDLEKQTNILRPLWADQWGSNRPKLSILTHKHSPLVYDKSHSALE